MPPRVVVAESGKYDAEIAREILEDVADVEVVAMETAEDLVAAAAGAEGLIPWYVRASSGLIERLDDLEIIGNPGVGVDSIDLDAAAANGVTVVNAPTYAREEVATHAMALLLDCVRSVRTYDRGVRAGEWGEEMGAPVHRLQGRVLGVLAFGDIGRRTAEMADAFGLDVIAHDPYVEDAIIAERGVEPVGFGELLERSRYLSVHAPLTDETEGLLDGEALASMPDGAVLVNTGRGPVVEEAGLLEALETGPLSAAGLDVFEREPPAGSPLLGREDVVLSPHVAWYSEESREDCIRSVAEDLRRYFEGGELVGRVDPDTAWR